MLCFSQNETAFKITVGVSDIKNFDGKEADVNVVLHDEYGKKSKTKVLEKCFRNDIRKGSSESINQEYSVMANSNLHRVTSVELWRDVARVPSLSIRNKADWFVNEIRVKKEATGDTTVFPVLGWVKSNTRYSFIENDTCLPQFDPQAGKRAEKLESKRSRYELILKQPGFPAQLKSLPEEENFSFVEEQFRKSKMLMENKTKLDLSKRWETFNDLRSIYSDNLPYPNGARFYREDRNFARQRTHGCSVGLIKRCTSIPSNFAVTDDMVSTLLEDLTLSDAIDRKRLFIVDLDVLTGLKRRKDRYICSPLALFFETKDGELTPLAIQLEQTPSADNPVFLPTDDDNTWFMAKLWFNNADALYHQAVEKLGGTHMIMEGVSVVTSRQLSSSHPIFRLLAPHFLFLCSVNRVEDKSLTEDGLIDKITSCGITGMVDLIARGNLSWRLDVHGNFPEFIAKRGLSDSPKEFPARDDALLLFNVIRNYVKKNVDFYYDSPEKLLEDWELRAWSEELVLNKERGGCGLKGVPGNGILTENEQLTTILTSFINICTVTHAAVTSPQYDEYAFPANYPSILNGRPATNKDPITDRAILDMLPDRSTTYDIMTVSQLHSNKSERKPLGDFEVNFTFDPPAVQFVEEFRRDLADAAKTIDERNLKRKTPYFTLRPDKIPNSIGI